MGVCLGHQLIGELWGATLDHARYPMHGKTSKILHSGQGIFEGIESPFQAMRYHSLILKKETVRIPLEIIAETPEKEVMGIRHTTLPLTGIQFHPESILTQKGEKILLNWLSSL